jgi:GNAT superfamily N-acetyltransferase
VDIRERRIEDLPALTKMAQVVHDIDGYPPHLPGELSEFIQSSDAIKAWVAESGGDVVGHVSLHSRSSRVVMDLATKVVAQPAECLGVVARLLVSPSVRRGGVGRILLNTAANHAVRLGLYPMLDVATRFEPAIKLYESCGWTRAGRVTVKMSNGISLDEFVYLGPVSRPLI